MLYGGEYCNLVRKEGVHMATLASDSAVTQLPKANLGHENVKEHSEISHAHYDRSWQWLLQVQSESVMQF